MSNSPLSFDSTNRRRKELLARNLAPYAISGVWSSVVTNYNTTATLSDVNVVDSPNTYISKPPFLIDNIKFNYFKPENVNYNIFYNNPPLTSNSNGGIYSPTQTNMDTLYADRINQAFISNIYGPEGGYKAPLTIDDLQINDKVYQPYWNPPIFTPSSYSAYQLFINPNAQGSNGSIKDDSQLAQIGATQLRDLFQARVDTELLKNSLTRTNLDGFTNPFFASLKVIGNDPVVEPNYRITVPEGPIGRVSNFIARVSGIYAPDSPIPGDYFADSIFGDRVSQKTVRTLGIINRSTFGSIGPALNLFRNPSETFLAYTSNGQKSILFNNLNYNRYKPNYDYGFGGIRGAVQTGVDAVVEAIIGGNSENYLGSRITDYSQITSPPNQVPVNSSGQQVQAPVYGPDQLGILFEGNEGKLNFGLAGKNLEEGGSIDGGFVWVSPKYKDNAGFKATPGGGAGNLDDDYNQIKSSYEQNLSTNLTFRPDTILDNTQRLVDSGDKVVGANRLKHVGNAINQVSKVFNDGYKEITKGSKVLSYVDSDTNNEIITTGREVGVEYCRLFTKDTPYYTYGDLQKTDGITTFGRKFSYSVLDNTYNLNIAPMRLPDSTNIKQNNEGKFVAKKYMLSIENLAWRTSSRPGFTYDDLPLCERGPNGGRIMWFPPYDLKFNDTSNASFQGTSFLGRPEPMYTYKETTRSGSLSFKIVVDHPSVMNTIVRKQLKGQTKERVESIVNSFFAGCVKYDIYELAKRYNTIPLSDLVRFQMAIENPNTSREQIERVANDIPRANPESNSNVQKESVPEYKNEWEELAFYFENQIPGPNSGTESNQDYEQTYNEYIAKENEYKLNADKLFAPNTSVCQKDIAYCQRNSGVTEFFNTIIKPSFNEFNTNFVTKTFDILDSGGEISIEMVGSASALGEPAFNKDLSARRIDSVIKFLKKQVSPKNQKKMSDYFDNNKIKITNTTPQGEETTSTPKLGKTVGSQVTCTQNVTGGSGGASDISLAQKFSYDAMACRRVVMKFITATKPIDENKKGDDVGVANPEPNGTPRDESKLLPIIPRTRTVPSPTAITEGISKKILRNLFSECDYFDVLKSETPMIYDSIKEKIKYFNPAFHSMTPEGLNSRLVFLNQCVRPGETIPTIGADGRPKFNDAVNTSFGTPPILVLRIGDFYNTKIVPDSVSFTYDPLNLDMNPEGIGLQPMIANVTLSFKIIGGMGLAKPVEELQNALSFSYYANTEIYDERATPTDESFKVLDKEILEALNNGSTQLDINNIQNNQTNGGGTTIGEVTSTTPITNAITGEIKYDKVMDDFLTQTSNYFQAVVNQLESINNSTNFGVVQVLNFSRKYNFGTLNTQAFDDTSTEEIQIYGKSNKWQDKMNEYFNNTLQDVDNDSSPIIFELAKILPNTSSYPMREIKSNLKNYLTIQKEIVISNITTPFNNLVDSQQNYVQNISKLNAIVNRTDGSIGEQGTPLIYNLSSGPYNELVTDFNKLKPTTEKFNTLLSGRKIAFNTQSDFSLLTNITSQSEKNFFLFMSKVLTNPNEKTNFINTLLATPSTLSRYETPIGPLKNELTKIVNGLSLQYQNEINKEKELFLKLKDSPQFSRLITGLESEMYEKGKSRIFTYDTTPYPPTENIQKQIIFNLYRTTNADNNSNSFINKITFN
jgi:hypothetical protein